MTPNPLYACLYVREAPAQALLRLRPELHSSACVVMAGEPPSEQVCSLNTRARLLGILPGMTRVEVETFPSPIILRRSGTAERVTRATLLEVAGAFSPRVEDRTTDAAFICAIDIAGTQTLFGPPANLAKALLAQVRAIGLSGRLSVSANLHAALYLAKAQLARTSVQVVTPGQEAIALAPLPISVLDLSEAQNSIFASWGITRLGQLAALPEAALIARMGQDARRIRQLASGTLPHLFQPVEPPFNLEDHLELDSPLEALESLLFIIARMLDQLIARAAARVLALASVTLTLHLEGGATHQRSVRPALPVNDKQLWIKLLQLDLESHPPPAAVLATSLRAESGSVSKVQLGLFTPQLPELGRLDITLALLSSLVGEGNAGSPALPDTHRPGAFRVQPFTLPRSDTSRINVLVRPSPTPQISLRQLRPPQPIAITLKEGRPYSFRFRTRRCTVEHAYGPWSEAGEWWNQDRYALNQWDLDARCEDGTLLFACLTHDTLRDHWHLTAIYD